jgi:hypothetical protein
MHLLDIYNQDLLRKLQLYISALALAEVEPVVRVLASPYSIYT